MINRTDFLRRKLIACNESQRLKLPDKVISKLNDLLDNSPEHDPTTIYVVYIGTRWHCCIWGKKGSVYFITASFHDDELRIHVARQLNMNTLFMYHQAAFENIREWSRSGQDAVSIEKLKSLFDYPKIIYHTGYFFCVLDSNGMIYFLRRTPSKARGSFILLRAVSSIELNRFFSDSAKGERF